MLFKIFSLLGSLVNPVIAILIGVLFTKIEDVLHTLNLVSDEKPLTPRKRSVIQLVKLIGVFKIIAGGLYLLDNVVDFIRYIFGMF